MIIKRIKQKYREEISEEQAGFVEDKETRDQIISIRNIMGKCKNYNIPMYVCFIDYAKKIDSVSHAQLWSIII